MVLGIGLRVSGSGVLSGSAGLKTPFFLWKEGLRAMRYIWKHTPQVKEPYANVRNTCLFSGSLQSRRYTQKRLKAKPQTLSLTLQRLQYP